MKNKRRKNDLVKKNVKNIKLPPSLPFWLAGGEKPDLPRTLVICPCNMRDFMELV